jgi:acyl carrier protein
MIIHEIVSKVNQIMIEGFEIEPSLLRPEAHLVEDLDLDSLDGVDIVVAVEKEFGIRVDEEDARAMKTLGDIYDYLRQSLVSTGRQRNV